MQLQKEIPQNTFRSSSRSKWQENISFNESMPIKMKSETQTVDFQAWGKQALTENTQESSLEQKQRVLSKANNQERKIQKLNHKCKRQKECIRQLTELIELQSQAIKQLSKTHSIANYSSKESESFVDPHLLIELEKARLKIKQLEANIAQPKTNRSQNGEKQNIRNASAEKISLLTKIEKLQWAAKKNKDQEELLRERNKELTEGNERLRRRLQDVKALNLSTEQTGPSYLNFRDRPEYIKNQFIDTQKQFDGPLERSKFVNEIKQLKKQISNLTQKVTSQTTKINQLEANLREEKHKFKEFLNSRKADALQYSQCLNENLQLKQQLSGVLQRNEARRKQNSLWNVRAQQNKQAQRLDHLLDSLELINTESNIK